MGELVGQVPEKSRGCLSCSWNNDIGRRRLCIMSDLS